MKISHLQMYINKQTNNSQLKVIDEHSFTFCQLPGGLLLVDHLIPEDFTTFKYLFSQTKFIT